MTYFAAANYGCPETKSGRHTWWRNNGLYECAFCTAPMPAEDDDQDDDGEDDR